MSEIVHPLGTDLEGLHGALLSGMLDSDFKIPDHIKVNYEDPIGGEGVGTLRIVDWETENSAAIYFPVIPNDPTWTIKRQGIVEEDLDVRHRVFVRDFLGRGFPVKIADESMLSSFLRFDVVDDGIILFANNEGTFAPAVGRYEGETYDMLDRMARTQSSVQALIELASRY